MLGACLVWIAVLRVVLGLRERSAVLPEPVVGARASAVPAGV